MFPPSLAHEPRRLLPGSVCGAVGLASVCVDCDRVKEGIMLVFKLLTLAERAKEDLVGVLTALGRPLRGILIVIVSSRELGRSADVSSSRSRLARLLGDVFSSLSLPVSFNMLEDLERGRLLGACRSFEFSFGREDLTEGFTYLIKRRLG